jgi:hypothetical protein
MLTRSRLASRSDAILQNILDTMHESDVFPPTGEDPPSRFWLAYERVAKQHDDELIERHSTTIPSRYCKIMFRLDFSVESLPELHK